MSLLSGHSGVGKSSFLNALFPELRLKTQGVSGWSGKGIHTTTFAEMFDLPADPGAIAPGTEGHRCHLRNRGHPCPRNPEYCCRCNPEHCCRCNPRNARLIRRPRTYHRYPRHAGVRPRRHHPAGTLRLFPRNARPCRSVPVQ
ncbi:GTPase RsgA [Puia sp. P3]|uniref:GTPase RsgA n=1 Tax=Puia sp. P3 TaxID=3423952 RepID=UPI003D673B4B